MSPSFGCSNVIQNFHICTFSNVFDGCVHHQSADQQGFPCHSLSSTIPKTLEPGRTTKRQLVAELMKHSHVHAPQAVPAPRSAHDEKPSTQSIMLPPAVEESVSSLSYTVRCASDKAETGLGKCVFHISWRTSFRRSIFCAWVWSQDSSPPLA